MSWTYIKRTFGAFVVAITLGSIGGMLFLILLATGKIRVPGYWRLMRQVAKGGTLIVANHPTLLETTIIPMMFWPWGVLWTKRFFPWSAPDGTLFPKRIDWLYDVAHCVKIDRASKGANHDAARLMRRILETGGTLIVHPEAGRTNSAFKSDDPPKKRFGHYHDRRIRRIVSGTTKIALDTNATIVPLWVDIPFWEEANGFKRPLWLWLTRAYRITIHVGEPYRVRTTKAETKEARLAAMHANNKELGARILRAGLE